MRSASWQCARHRGLAARCRTCACAGQVSSLCQTAGIEGQDEGTSTALTPVQHVTTTCMRWYNSARSGALAGIQQISAQGGRKPPAAACAGPTDGSTQTGSWPPVLWSVPGNRRQTEPVSHVGRICVRCSAVLAHPLRWLRSPAPAARATRVRRTSRRPATRGT